MPERAGGDTDDRARRRSVAVAATLALVAGYVDAVGYLRLFGAFPANQSGNAVLLGMSAADSTVPPAWVSATAIIGFAAGVAAAAWLSLRLPPHRRRTALLSAELALLVVLATAASVATTAGDEPALLDGAARFGLLLLAGVAMGVQTEVIRRAAGVAVSTTYQTGAIAHLGEVAGTRPGTPERTAASRAMLVLAAVLAAYVGGAAVGASRLGEGGTGLLAPCLVVGSVLVAVVATEGAGHRSSRE
jgi:uncharacterized membrane protein YoaK (UPF0700 family)